MPTRTGKCEKCNHPKSIHHPMRTEPYLEYCGDCMEPPGGGRGPCWPYEMTPEYIKAKTAAEGRAGG